ncbi:MAG: FtsX-like permease family protein [Bacteroidota bacterium]
MSISSHIATRYFFSRKSQRVINIISLISIVGVTIGTAALIIVLSVFNGFEGLIKQLYNSFDSDLRITIAEGKSFSGQDVKLNDLRKINGVQYVVSVVEENVLVKYRDKQLTATIKGVSDNYSKSNGIDTMLTDGTMLLQSGDTDFAVVGGAIAYNLQMSMSDPYTQLEIYAPRRTATSFTNPDEAFNKRYISPSGIFAIQQEFDNKYIIVPLRFANEIFEYNDHLTALEIASVPGTDVDQLQSDIQKKLGEKFVVKNRYQQHELLYRIMKSEKWAVFLILTFILVVAAFNVISSLTMLVIDKKKDIAVLQSFGADVFMVRKIFMIDGLLITMTGALSGLAIGFFVCWLQQEFGLIALGGSGTFVIDAYPVKMLLIDFIYVFGAVAVIGLLAAWYPSRRLIREEINLKMIAGDE